MVSICISLLHSSLSVFVAHFVAVNQVAECSYSLFSTLQDCLINVTEGS